MSKISSDEGASKSKACVIKGDKNCEADVIEVSEVAMDESMVDGPIETFSTLVPETSFQRLQGLRPCANVRLETRKVAVGRRRPNTSRSKIKGRRLPPHLF